MNLVCWNVRGLGNARAFDKLRMLIRRTSPSIVFLMESRLFGVAAKSVLSQLGFENGFHVNCEGRSGGLILLWNSKVDVQIQSYSRGHVDSLV